MTNYERFRMISTHVLVARLTTDRWSILRLRVEMASSSTPMFIFNFPRVLFLFDLGLIATNEGRRLAFFWSGRLGKTFIYTFELLKLKQVF